MQKIGDTTKTADSNGEFTDGDPQKQISCTWIMAAWLNTLQREVIKVVQEGGLTLNPKDDTQLYQAIEKLIGNSETDLKSQTLRQIRLPPGATTHWLKIASMIPAGNSEVRIEVELSGMSDYGTNAGGMAVDRVYMTTRGASTSQRVTAATVGNLIRQFTLSSSVNASKYQVGVTEEVSNGTTTRYNFWLKMNDHTGISSTMNLLNSTTNGVTVTDNFSGVNTTSTEPAGIVYAAREQFITTANPQTALQTKAADWTNNFAAKMGIARVITGANKPTSPGVWSVENSTWTPYPYGTLYATTNGTDLSATSANDRFIHYLFIAHGTGNKLFVATDVNGVFGGWFSYISSRGGTFIGQIISPSFASTPEAMPRGAGAYADQLSTQAPFFQPNWQWPVDAGGIFVPIAKGTSTRKDKGYPTAVTYGYLMPGTNEFAHPTIHVRGDNNFECVWDFNPYSGGISSKEGTFATREWVNTNTFNGGNHPTQSSVSGNQWWYKDLCTGMIFQGGYAEGQNTDARDRIALNISVPNRLLYVSTIIKNYAQGYGTTYNPQVGDLTGERDGFWWFHGAQERVIYWMAVGY